MMWLQNYSTLCKTLKQLKEIKQTEIGKSLGVVKFRPSQNGNDKTVDLGSISSGLSPGEGNGKWVSEKEIGKQGETKGAYGVAVGANKSILIADYDGTSVKVFDNDGNFKQVIQDNLSNPNDIVMSTYGYHVADTTSHIKVFSPECKYVKQFPVISPDGKASDTDGSQLYGLAIDNDGNLLVGSFNKNYISKHHPHGAHISTFSINIKPWFLKVTSNGNIVVTAFVNNVPAEILAPTGELLHTINKPKDVNNWKPSGICCSDDGVIYITSYSPDNQGGIYSFTEEGKYLGCVITDVAGAIGTALYDNKMVVARHAGLPAKVFCYRET